IEEAGRHYGFDKLEATFPVMTQPAPPPDPRIPRDQLVRRVLTFAGCSEAVTFGFIETAAAEPFLSPVTATEMIAIANPLSAKFDTLRPSLLPGLVDAVAYNRRHRPLVGRRSRGRLLRRQRRRRTADRRARRRRRIRATRRVFSGRGSSGG